MSQSENISSKSVFSRGYTALNSPLMQYAYRCNAQLKTCSSKKTPAAQNTEQYGALRDKNRKTEHFLFPEAKYRGAKHTKNLTASHQHTSVFEENITLTAPVCLSKCQEDYTANTGIIVSFLVY